MPIIGTPFPTPPTQEHSPFVVTPLVTSLYGTPILSKMRSVVVLQSQYANLQLQILNPNTYTPTDLTTFDLSNGPVPTSSNTNTTAWIKFRFMESTGLSGPAADGTTQNVVDDVNGIVNCVVPDTICGNPGIYQCEAGLFDQNDRLLFSNTFYVLVDRGLFTNSLTTNISGTGDGMPSLNEIRLSTRDAPELNNLTDDFEFDISDICDAIVRAVLYFNTSQPPLSVRFSTVTFPWRHQWMDGIASHLFEMATNFYRRSHLKYQAGGLTVDDLDREREYLQAWQIRNERWQKWVQMKKVELNMSEGFSTVTSGYWSTSGGSYIW